MKTPPKITIRVDASVLESVLDTAERELNERNELGADTGDATNMVGMVWDAIATGRTADMHATLEHVLDRLLTGLSYGPDMASSREVCIRDAITMAVQVLSKHSIKDGGL